ncbi:MAG: hypothetical protein WBV94_23600 [Blastocatellia bacterium]
MRRPFIIWGIILLAQLLTVSAYAQQDKLSGRWEGTIQMPQGERPATASFKKEGEAYTGNISGMRPGSEMQLKEIKVDGNKVTAKAVVESPQGTFTINFTLMINGETLKGEGALDFSGQSLTLDVSLKRAGDAAQGAPSSSTQPQQPPAGQGPGQGQQRPRVPQPQQKQSIDYFVGQWSYKYVGRESALGPAPRDCTVTFTKRADGKSLDSATTCKYDGGVHKESSVIVFDDATKMMTFTEKLGNGVAVNSRGDWTSPISIRFTVDPIKVKSQSLQLRRTISIVAAHSFTIAEELSEDGGPFIRLGNAVVTRVEAK